MNNDDLHRRLDDLGRSATPPVDPAFAERLEADLRSARYFSPGKTPTPNRRPILLRPGALALVALVLIAGTVALVASRDPAPTELIIDQASGIEVQLPGETPRPGLVGERLPDGTRIEVDTTGSAVIDGITLEPGAIAEVVDGRIELRTPQPDRATPLPTPLPTTQAVPPPTPATITTPTPPTATPEPAQPTVTPEPTAVPSETPPSRPTPEPTAPAPARPLGRRARRGDRQRWRRGLHLGGDRYQR